MSVSKTEVRGSSPRGPAVSEANKEIKQANCLACVEDEKSFALFSSSLAVRKSQRCTVYVIKESSWARI